jgi:hypothetical protein
MQHVMWVHMATLSPNLNLTFTSRNIPEKKLISNLLETKKAASIYSMLERIRSVQRCVTSCTGTGYFFCSAKSINFVIKIPFNVLT